MEKVLKNSDGILEEALRLILSQTLISMDLLESALNDKSGSDEMWQNLEGALVNLRQSMGAFEPEFVQKTASLIYEKYVGGSERMYGPAGMERRAKQLLEKYHVFEEESIYQEAIGLGRMFDAGVNILFASGRDEFVNFMFQVGVAKTEDDKIKLQHFNSYSDFYNYFDLYVDDSLKTLYRPDEKVKEASHG